MRVAIYERASNYPGLSAQWSYIKTCLRRHPDWEVVARYADIGPQAYAARPGLQRLLAEAARKKFDIALAQSAVRFAPDNITVLRLANQLSRFGVDMKFANGIDCELMPTPKAAQKKRQPTRNWDGAR